MGNIDQKFREFHAVAKELPSISQGGYFLYLVRLSSDFSCLEDYSGAPPLVLMQQRDKKETGEAPSHLSHKKISCCSEAYRQPRHGKSHIHDCW